MSRPTIRRARPEEAAVLSALALRSKAHWGYSDVFMKMCVAELSYTPEQIGSDTFEFAVAESNQVVCGFYALDKNDRQAISLEALFVEPEFIGTGVGRQLIQHALHRVEAAGAERLLIDGDPNAEAFYVAAGGRLIGSSESGSVPGRQLPLFEIRVPRDPIDQEPQSRATSSSNT